MAQAVGFSRALATVRRTVAARRDAKRRARAVRIPPCSPCIVCRKNKKQRPAGCCLWRRRWDSNPRGIAAKLISRSWMDNTIAALRLFLLAVHSSNTQNIKSINAETINCFSTAMSNASEICMNVRRARCRQVGAYLHWLYDHKYTDLDYSLQLPNFKRTAPQIPQVWSPEEIDKILAVIDTANPVGRRNYAIFLLLARTGLRISDVLGLKFSNINWKENCISLSQQKTGNALSLPLSKELGMAIISYLQDGRPQSSSAFIFLSHNAPFQPLGEHNNFNPEFHKYLRRAGIAIPTKRHTGVHTIRHSFATNMLRKGTPVQDVSQILGHSNISVTETYLRVDIEHMRLCSLSLEGLL